MGGCAVNKRCRHRNSWLIADGAYEWCYECGAFRGMTHIDVAAITPRTPWCKPVGPNGENPYTLWAKRCTTYSKRHVKR